MSETAFPPVQPTDGGLSAEVQESSINLYCGDAVRIMSGMEAGSVDLLIADPPYNLGKHYGNNIDLRDWREYENFTRSWLEAAIRLLHPEGSLYVFMGVRFIARLYCMLEEVFGLRFRGWITWHYTQGMGRTRGFSPRHEDILYFSRGPRPVFNLDDIRVPQKYFRKRNNMAGANPGDVWQFSHVHYCAGERERHPTQKPEALMERIVRASSKPGAHVLDPFLGSGTTARVCQALERRCSGIDINPDYIALAQRRLARPFTGFDSVDPRMQRTPRDLPRKG